MDLFCNTKYVRLRSFHGKYLVADDNGQSVSQSRVKLSKNSEWGVEFVEGTRALRLKSCYSLYLTASDLPFLLKWTGKKVLQSSKVKLASSVEWEPIRDGFHVKLKGLYGNFLRANGGPPPWRNSVTHDIPLRTATQDWVLWEVEILETEIESPLRMPLLTLGSPDVQTATSASSEADSESFASSTSSSSTPKSDGRIIYFAVGDHDGDVEDSSEWFTITFRGSDLYGLKDKLKEETGIDNPILCSKNSFNGELFPLHLPLPPGNASMRIVLIQSSPKCKFSYFAATAAQSCNEGLNASKTILA
ncbi:uncharacterized protein LOC18428414 isoform X2 [Amborella trichopoda]|uniref:uncharacterized protein LOC18428414 isoform X2 n=1 Tax=Amborella trichopoda TaxID=13333 RepID=UPI0009BDB90F|nr:uncharacterized protein LOC18428414 isoform X2 [Amborella trichopoda]|eukprot:XP_020519426.1 uncharacterized protein LOC18428414 isoform X2 [Amborella trichopoda]